MSKELTKNVENNVANTNSQHLTEQWRNGTLNGGIYYLLLRDGTTVKDKTVYIVGEKQLRWHYSSFDFVKEVLASVPDYEELQSYEKSSDLLIDVNKKWEKAIIEKKHLVKQLKEANKIIKKLYKESGNPIGCDYLEKWGVK